MTARRDVLDQLERRSCAVSYQEAPCRTTLGRFGSSGPRSAGAVGALNKASLLSKARAEVPITRRRAAVPSRATRCREGSRAARIRVFSAALDLRGAETRRESDTRSDKVADSRTRREDRRVYLHRERTAT